MGRFTVLVLTLTALWAVGCDDGDDDVAKCDQGFDQAEWKRDMKATGQAIAECDWFDSTEKADVLRAIGKPDHPPHRGWHTWEIGTASEGIGPEAWFLLLRIREGVVTKSVAEVRPT